MSSDTLTIVLFFIGTAVSLAGTAVNAAGWRHPWLIRGLLALSALVAVVGIAWPLLGPQAPRLNVIISEIASNPAAWFVVIMVGVAAPFLRLRADSNAAQQK